jgi:hypothetical protein
VLVSRWAASASAFSQIVANGRSRDHFTKRHPEHRLRTSDPPLSLGPLFDDSRPSFLRPKKLYLAISFRVVTVHSSRSWIMNHLTIHELSGFTCLHISFMIQTRAS